MQKKKGQRSTRANTDIEQTFPGSDIAFSLQIQIQIHPFSGAFLMLSQLFLRLHKGAKGELIITFLQKRTSNNTVAE